MDRRITNTMPPSVKDEEQPTEEAQRNHLVPQERGGLSPLVRIKNRKTKSSVAVSKLASSSFQSPTSSLTAMMSPLGSKRKASEQSASPQETDETARARLHEDRRQVSLPRPPFLARYSTADGPSDRSTSLEEQEEEEAYRQKMGYEKVEPKEDRPSSVPWRAKLPKIRSKDDLDGTMNRHYTEKRQRKYRRRNSFFVHRGRGERGFSQANNIFRDMQTVCRGEEEERSIVLPPAAHTRVSRTKSYSPINSTEQAWGNASWANSDDTTWYSGLSSLSFDSKPTIPSPLASSLPASSLTNTSSPPALTSTITNDEDATAISVASVNDSNMFPPPMAPRPSPPQATSGRKHTSNARYCK